MTAAVVCQPLIGIKSKLLIIPDVRDLSTPVL